MNFSSSIAQHVTLNCDGLAHELLNQDTTKDFLKRVNVCYG